MLPILVVKVGEAVFLCSSLYKFYPQASRIEVDSYGLSFHILRCHPSKHKSHGQGDDASLQRHQAYATAKNAAMGTVKKGKQNNFRISDLMEKSISWSELSKQIDNFLSP